MTANSNADLFRKASSNGATDKDEAGKAAPKRSSNNNQYNSNRITNVIPQRRDATIDNIMNLRNRPLKAATAGTDSNSNPGSNNVNDNISTATTNKTNATVSEASLKDSSSISRRRSRRHQQQSSASSATSALHQVLSPSSSSKQPTSLPVSTRSIRSFFPLRTIGAVCELFRFQLDPQSTATGKCSRLIDSDSSTVREDGHFEPDLALLSIVIGIIETSMTRGLYEDDTATDMHKFVSDETSTTTTNDGLTTNKKNLDCHHSTTTIQNSAGNYSPAEATPAPIVAVSNVIHTPLDIPIPTVFYENVESLLKKFTIHIKESIDLSKYPKKTTTRELIKKISEVIWSNLHRSHYKDRAHLQTIFSYITENRLDCYGVAYTVLAACQILGLDDVRLVMSEDHTWVIFGEDETCEVTWHGKCGNDDRCGQPIPKNINCWLYLNGNTMICDRFLTVATLVSAMNLSINATQDSEELAILQQQLLWILYDYGYLQKYPMALGNLGDLGDVCVHGISKKHPNALFDEAIESAKKYYNNYHVYPYTYIAGYYFRTGKFKDALKYWADAAQVIKKYNYTRDDEEIYKEFQEIANDLIPYIVKYSSNSEKLSVLQDPECFVYLLKFYDGLCAWEEDSSTPVLHIGWTKPIVSTISKFPYSTRSLVSIKVNHLNEKIYTSDNEDDEQSENAFRERRRRRVASISSTTLPLEKICEENISKEKAQENGKNIFGKNGESYNNYEIGDKIRKKSLRKNQDSEEENDNDDRDQNEKGKTVFAILSSKKFSGIKNLLTADKLNTSAIQLQLTAQSQVNINKRNRTTVGTKSSYSHASFSELDFVSTTTTTLMRTNSNKRFRRE